jgi:hypothetical protein
MVGIFRNYELNRITERLRYEVSRNYIKKKKNS